MLRLSRLLVAASFVLAVPEASAATDDEPARPEMHSSLHSPAPAATRLLERLRGTYAHRIALSDEASAPHAPVRTREMRIGHFPFARAGVFATQRSQLLGHSVWLVHKVAGATLDLAGSLALTGSYRLVATDVRPDGGAPEAPVHALLFGLALRF